MHTRNILASCSERGLGGEYSSSGISRASRSTGEEQLSCWCRTARRGHKRRDGAMGLRIAVLSDLHCHPASVQPCGSLLLSDALRRPEKQHPVQALLDAISADSIEADLVLLSGDITYQIDRQGIISGWAFAKEISAALGAEILVPTIGNHDVDSRSSHQEYPNPFHIAENFSLEFPTCDRYQQNDFWKKGACLVRQQEYAVLSINSSMKHFRETDCRKGGVSDECLDHIRALCREKALPDLRIAVCHHHPILHDDVSGGDESVMDRGDKLMSVLDELDFSILVHGHKHTPRLRYARPGAKRKRDEADGAESGRRERPGRDADRLGTGFRPDNRRFGRTTPDFGLSGAWATARRRFGDGSRRGLCGGR